MSCSTHTQHHPRHTCVHGQGAGYLCVTLLSCFEVGGGVSAPIGSPGSRISPLWGLISRQTGCAAFTFQNRDLLTYADQPRTPAFLLCTRCWACSL